MIATSFLISIIEKLYELNRRKNQEMRKEKDGVENVENERMD